MYGLFGHVSPNRLCTGERSKKQKGTSFIVSIDKQELNLFVLTVGTIKEDYIVLGSVWQINKLPACSKKGLTHSKKKQPQKHKMKITKPPN